MRVAWRLQSSIRLVNSWPESKLNEQELVGLFNCSLPLTRLMARFNPKVRVASWEDVLFESCLDFGLALGTGKSLCLTN